MTSTVQEAVTRPRIDSPGAQLPASLRHFRELSLEGAVEVLGTSMKPLIRPRSTIRLRGDGSPPRVGEVLAFWNGERVVVHRVERLAEIKGRLCFQARGDSNPRPDPWAGADVIVGRVVAIPERPSLALRLRAATLRALRRVTHVSLNCGFSASNLDETKRLNPMSEKSPLDANSVFRRRQGLTIQDLSDEILVREEDGTGVHVLNRTARGIWQRLDGRISLGQIAEQMGQEYDRDVLEDVLAFASALREQGLIEDATP